MNLIIQTILGNQTELTQQGRLNGQSRDSVTLKWYEADRRILRTTTASSTSFDLARCNEGGVFGPDCRARYQHC